MVNYCTEGETVTQIDSISRSVSFDAICTRKRFRTDTGYADLVAIMETKESHMFKIEG